MRASHTAARRRLESRLCASPCWASRLLAGRRRSVQRLPRRGRRARCLLLDCGNGVFSQAAPLPRLRRRRRGRHLAPARRPLPRPRPVRLRADLRAAPAAGPGRPLAGHRAARRARSCSLPPGARARRCARSSRRSGQPRICSTTPSTIREYDARATSSRSARCALRFQPVPHYMPTNAIELSPVARRRALHLRRRPPPDRRARELRRRHRPADARGDAAAPRARRRRAGTSRPPRPASTPARCAAARLVLTHISDELDEDVGARRGAAARSPGRSRSRARAPSTRSEPAAAAAVRAMVTTG